VTSLDRSDQPEEPPPAERAGARGPDRRAPKRNHRVFPAGMGIVGPLIGRGGGSVGDKAGEVPAACREREAIIPGAACGEVAAVVRAVGGESRLVAEREPRLVRYQEHGERPVS
jgi:hypothetical protein